jgi:hypothetical protein
VLDPGPTTPPSPAGRFEAPQPAELAPHFPQLEILELLGQGGMGAVYKARQRQLNRLVALKILPPQVAADPAFAERFTREAQALAQLNHPHIVAVHDSGQAGGLYYFVMEYVDGVNLRRMLAEGKLAPAEALAIVPQICEALQYAHDEGVVHRDIKPENLLLDKRGRVKIADFGLARLVGPSRPDFTLTGTQQVMGTPHYMAPEQMERPQAVDHRADIYSLGVVFYEMLTGELPLGRFQPPSKKVEIDVRLDDVVLRSLEREPERRYQQASSVKSDLEGITRGSFAPSGPEASVPAFRPAAQAAAVPVLAIAGFAMMLLAGMFFIAGSPTINLLPRNIASFSGIAAGMVGTLLWMVYGILSQRHNTTDTQTVPGEDSGRSRSRATAGNVTAAKAADAHLVQAPADCLLLAAGIALATACGVAVWLLAAPASSLTTSLNRGNLIGISFGLAIYSLFIGVAGLVLRRLRARLVVLLIVVVVGLFFPAVVALNVVMEFRHIPVWPVAIPLWLGTPAGLWVAVTLFRDDVRRAFDRVAAPETSRPDDSVKSQQPNPVQRIAKPGAAVEPTWQNWWFEQTPATRKMLKVALYAFAVLQMIFFAATEVQGRRGHTSVEVGMGGSWLTYETGQGLELDLLNWSFMSGILAVAAAVVLWRVIQVERRHALATGHVPTGFWSSAAPSVMVAIPLLALAVALAAVLIGWMFGQPTIGQPGKQPTTRGLAQSPDEARMKNPASKPPDSNPDRVRLDQVGHLAVVGDDPFLSLAVQGKHAYLIQGNVEKPKRLQVVDLSDAALPRIVGSCHVTVGAGRLAVSGEYVCVLDDPHFRVLDVSQPTAPREVGSCELGELLWDVAVQGRYAYVTDVHSLRVIDLENPAAPRQVGRCDLVTAQGVCASGKYAYVACDIEGLYVLDISDPKQPQVIGEFAEPAGAADVVEVGENAYVVGGEDAVTLWIADVSNPRRPRAVGKFGDWIQGSIAVQGNYAYLAGGDLDIVDISNHDAPTQAGSYPNASEIVAADGLLYVVNDAGLSILRVVETASAAEQSRTP